MILRSRAAGLCTAIAIALAPALASADDVPAPLQVSILLKVLVYDRSLATRARDGLSVDVVFDPKSDASRACKDAFLKAFNDVPRQLAGTAIVAGEIAQDSLADTSRGLDVLYVCTAAKVAPVVEFGHKKSLITVSGDEEAVKQGVAIGVVPRDGKPKLLINVSASLASGMQLDPQILRLAELVR